MNESEDWLVHKGTPSAMLAFSFHYYEILEVINL
jgi:hypothetical protein